MRELALPRRSSTRRTGSAPTSDRHPLLHLQRSVGNEAVAGLVQRKEGQDVAAAAGSFSRRVRRFGDSIVPGVRVALGLDATNAWDDAASAALRQLQTDADAPATGTLDDERTLRWLIDRMTSGRKATPDTKIAACWLLVDWFDMPVRSGTTFAYDEKLPSPGQIDPWGYNDRKKRGGKGPMPPARILFGPMAFDKDLAGLANTIRHELFHGEQHLRKVPGEVKDTDPAQLDHRDEFEAEWLEMTNRVLPSESVGGFADDALRAIETWDLMTAPNRRAMQPKFKAMLAMVKARLANSPEHQHIVRRWVEPTDPPSPIVREAGPKEILIQNPEDVDGP